jgi:aspartyl-tRNA(Asn)/glutamyl-tRNA(Gln) amidotransferase subunit C
MSKLSKETVEQVATLARLKLGENEIADLTDTLSAVLTHFEQIVNVDTKDVKPLITPTDMTLNLREDVVALNESSEEAQALNEKLLENAPEKSGRLFKVPPVV